MPTSPLIPSRSQYDSYRGQLDTSIKTKRKSKNKSKIPSDTPILTGISQFYTSTLGIGKSKKQSTYLEKLREAKEIGMLSWSKGNRYEIIDAIAVGGMGAILRARDQDTQRDVAMKVMLRTHPDSPTAKRFIREAHIVASLEHPNIVPVHDIGFSPLGEPYFTMKWVQGENLADVLFKLGKGEPLHYLEKYNLSSLLDIFVQICNGVAFAHSRNLVHLDLKPHNILVGDYGEVLVLDWGLASKIDRKDHRPNSHTGEDVKGISKSQNNSSVAHHSILTEDGTIKGTPGFMAPEQADGEIVEVDERSDIFSLGSILYMMLTLKLPIVGEKSSEILHHTIKGNFVPPGKRIYHKAVPKELEAIVMKAMALKKADRFNSVDNLQKDVSNYLRGYAISIEKGGLFKKFFLALKRNRREFRLVGINGVITIILICFVILAFTSRLESQIKKTRRERKHNKILQIELAAKMKDARKFKTKVAKKSSIVVEKNKIEVNEAQTRADFQSYIANIRLSDMSIERSRYKMASNALEDCPKAFRHWEWGRLKHLTQLDYLTIPHSRIVKNVCMNKQGTVIALADTDQNVTLRHIRTGKTLALDRNDEFEINGMALTADASKLVIGYNKGVEFWELKTKKPVRLILEHTEQISALDINDNGTIIAAGRLNGTVVMWNTQQGEQIQSIRAHDGTVTSIVLSRQGQRLLTGGLDGTVKLWDSKTGQLITTMDGHFGPILCADMDYQHHLVVTGSQDQTVRVWDTRDGHQIQVLTPEFSDINAVAISSDAQSILVGGATFTAGIWDLQSGAIKQLFSGHGAPIVSAAFIQNGNKVVTASQDQTIKIWLVNGSDEFRTLQGHEAEVVAVAVSPDNQFMATGSADHTVKIWSLAGGEVVQTFKDYPGTLNGICFSPDGEELITVTKKGSDSSAVIWKLNTGLKRSVLVGHEGDIGALAASHDYRKIITGGFDGTARIWNVINGRQLHMLVGHNAPVGTVAISADGFTCATAGEDKTIRVWNAETGKKIYQKDNLNQSVTALSFSLDATLLVAGTTSGEIFVFNTKDGKIIQSLKGHWGRVNSICISRDDRRLFTASLDATIKVWDLDSGVELLTLQEPNKSAINTLTLTPDNGQLITGGVDSQVVIWQTSADWTKD